MPSKQKTNHEEARDSEDENEELHGEDSDHHNTSSEEESRKVASLFLCPVAGCV